jgi:hypothetical protein
VAIWLMAPGVAPDSARQFGLADSGRLHRFEHPLGGHAVPRLAHGMKDSTKLIAA